MDHAGVKLEKVVGNALRRVPREQGVVLAWPLACGSAVADRTRALSFSRGVLLVEVVNQGWRRELSFLAGQYLAAINRYSPERVERIEFVLSK